MSAPRKLTEGTRIPELDGLRGVAVLLVLFYHFGGYETAAPIEKLLRVLTGISFGWSGVDLFFVLSGFLITTILLETRESNHYFRDFYARRALRIFPLYWLVVLAAFFVVIPMAQRNGWGLDLPLSEWPWHVAYLSNWRSGVGIDVRPLTHFWSLAVEEQFYLVWPLAVLLLPGRRLTALCLLLIAAIPLARLAFVPEIDIRALYRFTVFRLDALVMGALVAQIVRDAALTAKLRRFRWPVAAAGVLIVLAAAVASRSSRPYTPTMSVIGFTGWGLLYSSIVFHLATASGSGGVFASALRWKRLMRFGQYSYALYVFHYPIVMLVEEGSARLARALGLPNNLLFAWLSILVGISATYGIAMLSWRWVESPILRLKRLFPYDNTDSPQRESARPYNARMSPESAGGD